jgi:hypothetical protein
MLPVVAVCTPARIWIRVFAAAVFAEHDMHFAGAQLEINFVER